MTGETPATQPHSPESSRAGQVCDGKYSLGQKETRKVTTRRDSGGAGFLASMGLGFYRWAWSVAATRQSCAFSMPTWSDGVWSCVGGQGRAATAWWHMRFPDSQQAWGVATGCREAPGGARPSTAAGCRPQSELGPGGGGD